MSESVSEPTITGNMSLLSTPKSEANDAAENKRSNAEDDNTSTSENEFISSQGTSAGIQCSSQAKNKSQMKTNPDDDDNGSNNHSIVDLSMDKTSLGLLLKEISFMARDLANENDELNLISVKNAILMDELVMAGAEIL